LQAGSAAHVRPHGAWQSKNEPYAPRQAIAMLLGDDAIPKPAALRQHAAEAVRMFLAAYGT